MELSKIRAIRDMYQKTRSHKKTEQAFGLNSAQEYAINKFCRTHSVRDEVLADVIDSIRPDMKIGEVAEALGYSAQAALDV